jgi:hypothetical protein
MAESDNPPREDDLKEMRHRYGMLSITRAAAGLRRCIGTVQARQPRPAAAGGSDLEVLVAAWRVLRRSK